jgi:hypothetical protein
MTFDQVGYGGYYRPGQWFPVRVELTSNSGNVRGHLQVRTSNLQNDSETVYKKPVVLARNSPKTETLYVSLNNRPSNIEVELVDQSGRVIERISERVLTAEPRDILYAVVTDDTLYGPVDLTQNLIGMGRSYQVNWQVDDIPTEAQALRPLDVLMIFNADTSDMGPDSERIQALENWVHSGGHLIVHSGGSENTIAEGIESLLPTRVTGEAQVPSLEALGTFLGHPSRDLAGSAFVSQNIPSSNAETLLAIDNVDGVPVPLIVREQRGAGVVDFVGISPHDGVLREYDDRELLWFELAVSTPLRPSWNYGFEDWDAASRAVQVVTGFELPDALQMFGFLILYVILIGPINYLALKAINRLELAWVTIPALILVFTLVAYFTGFSLRGSDATVSHLSIIQSWPDTGTARVDGLIGVFSPRRTTTSMTLEEDMSLRTLPLLPGTDAEFSNIDIEEGSDYRVLDLPIDAGIVASFSNSGAVESPDLGGEANWHLNNTDIVQLNGYIWNNEEYDLEDVVVIAKDGFEALGTLEAGEQRSFNMSVTLNSAMVHPLGNRTSVDSPAATGFFRGRAPTSYPYGNYNQDYCGTGGFNITTSQIMTGKTFDCFDLSDENKENQILRRRALMLSAINNDIDNSGGRDGEVYVVGWSERAPYELTVNADTQTNEYETLHIFQLNTNFIADDRDLETVMVPAGLMTWTQINRDDPNLRLNVSPYYLSELYSGVAAYFRFAPVSNLELENVERLDVSATMSFNQDFVSISLWDWQEGVWVEQDFDQQGQLDIPDPDGFLGPANAIHVRVEMEQDNVRANNFELELALHGQLAG